MPSSPTAMLQCRFRDTQNSQGESFRGVTHFRLRCLHQRAESKFQQKRAYGEFYRQCEHEVRCLILYGAEYSTIFKISLKSYKTQEFTMEDVERCSMITGFNLAPHYGATKCPLALKALIYATFIGPITTPSKKTRCFSCFASIFILRSVSTLYVDATQQ